MRVCVCLWRRTDGLVLEDGPQRTAGDPLRDDGEVRRGRTRAVEHHHVWMTKRAAGVKEEGKKENGKHITVQEVVNIPEELDLKEPLLEVGYLVGEYLFDGHLRIVPRALWKGQATRPPSYKAFRAG